MLVYELHYEHGKVKPFPVLKVTGEQAQVKIERAGSNRLLKFPLYAFNEGKKQNFIVRWSFRLFEGDKERFIKLFNRLAPHFVVLGANLEENNTLASASGIASCTEEELLNLFRVIDK